jgi:hypothetical protein
MNGWGEGCTASPRHLVGTAHIPGDRDAKMPYFRASSARSSGAFVGLSPPLFCRRRRWLDGLGKCQREETAERLSRQRSPCQPASRVYGTPRPIGCHCFIRSEHCGKSHVVGEPHTQPLTHPSPSCSAICGEHLILIARADCRACRPFSQIRTCTCTPTRVGRAPCPERSTGS